ncbi:unnamed protein product [Rhizoctonia solani]|uniref:F-box domain-containing protein n=1 Tax=Rhizoctonia solani TaxID=456999 RepID=A0A8H3ASK0_9AGAM|nr:unnamed protein product [Rhizoctonia solani]
MRSARLLSAKGKSRTEKEHDTSEKEEAKSPPRKRQRATNKVPKVLPGTKQILDKQSFATLADMPLDIFIEIATYLLPIDVIHMARLTKSTRSMLMHRSSIHVWHASMRNIPNLPDCPPDLSEPYFLSLVFLNACSACGQSTRTKLDETLRVRLCGPCRSEHLVYGADVPRELDELLHWSSKLKPPKGRLGDYTLRADYEAIKVEHKQIKAKSKKAVKEWTKEKEVINGRRQNEAAALTRFMEAMEMDRQSEQADTSKARWKEIQRRLREMGWEPKDMDFTNAWSTKTRQWRTIVVQPKPITDRVWAHLIPKLVPLLEINRNERLRVESRARKRTRGDHLKGLMDSLKRMDYSAFKLEANLRLPLPGDAYATTTVTYQAPFPTFLQALTWPVLNSLYETDVSITDMNESFEQQREGIKTQITEWQSYIQGYFMGLLDAQGEGLQPATGVDHPNLSDDLKCLLRADVLFRSLSSNHERNTPLNYDSLWTFGTLLSSSACQSSGSSSSSWLPHLDHLVLYPEAQVVARVLLADMGIPDASCLEMQGYQTNFVCGRCHDANFWSWAGLVQHYVQANELYNNMQKTSPETTYKHVHDPLYTDRPMVIHDSPSVKSGAGPIRWRICMLCEALPVKNQVGADKARIIQHVVDVHDIAEPVMGKHYRRDPTVRSGLPKAEDSDSD